MAEACVNTLGPAQEVVAPMQSQDNQKRCSRCGEWKDCTEFYRNRSKPDGLQHFCKVCLRLPEARERHREKSRRYRERHQEQSRNQRQRWGRANLEKKRAHSHVYAALKDGRLERPERCERCGVACMPDAHHPDYGKPLDVAWLCRACHGYVHAAVARQALSDPSPTKDR